MKGNCGECERRWFCDINPDECDAWPDPIPQTNADHIRSMTDEELARMLWKTGRNYRAIRSNPVEDFEEHTAGLINWLKQPYKEDT